MYERFAELLKISRVSVADLCRDTGLKESSLSNWKKRSNGINTNTLIAICNYFGVSADYLLGLSSVRPQPIAPALSFEDKAILDAYHKQPDAVKTAICDMLHVKRDLLLSKEA